MNVLLDLIHDMFPLRNCKILRNNDRPCMQYQIKKCAAPCCGLITAEEYQANIAKAVQIIKGNRKEVIRELRDEMMRYADEWKFEQAGEVKRKIEALENFIGKSVVVNPSLTDMDVFGMEEDADNNCFYVSFLRVVDGAVVQAHTLEGSSPRSGICRSPSAATSASCWSWLSITPTSICSRNGSGRISPIPTVAIYACCSRCRRLWG